MKELEKMAKQQEEKAKALSELAQKCKGEGVVPGREKAEGMADELKQEMKKLTEQVKKMSQEEKNELADALKSWLRKRPSSWRTGSWSKSSRKRQTR